MALEIVGSKEEVRKDVWRNWEQCKFSGSLHLLGLLLDFAREPHEHPLCHRRGKTFFWSFFLFQPWFLFLRCWPPLQRWLCQTGATLSLQSAWFISDLLLLSLHHYWNCFLSLQCHWNHCIVNRCAWPLHWFGSSFLSRRAGWSLRYEFPSSILSSHHDHQN